ncbi:hypothetical protein [Pontiella sp.]|uniref:hypothetical protein n=1 Tax=Pontiella sp. TaxID=2837462 RepID=UPI0035622988
MSRLWKILFILSFGFTCRAQMPHECLLLVNRLSQDSMKVANHYLEVRQIPRRNVVYLDIPENLYGGTATMTPEEFTWLIWEPANQVVKARGLENQILAWIYSADFPIRVKTDANDRKQMSVGGMTFMRNKMPGLSMVEEGRYLSKLFAGPNQRFKLNLSSMSLGKQKKGVGPAANVPPEASWLQQGLGDRMPLPSMMLGYIGENGNTVETVIDCLTRGSKSDFRGPRGGIYFVQSDDVRSTCRDWQFYPVVNELQGRNFASTVTTNFPAGEQNVMGILMGAENVDPSQVGSFAPGAMAEHLTSWSAEFQKGQTKCTAWIEAGATATAGAVVEPYSNSDKFPSARFYAHYAAGCTMLESFYQSVACPLQLLLLGDPLAKPYALPFNLKVLGTDTMKNDFTYLASAESRVQGAVFEYTFLLDDAVLQEASEVNSIYLRTHNLSDGYHELKAVASIRHAIEFNMTAVKPIMVSKSGRSVSINPDIKRLAKQEHGLRADIGGVEKPKKIRLVSGELILDEKVYGEEVELVLDESQLGEGPNRVRIVGIYADGMEVSSVPLSFNITFAAD